MFEMPPPSPGRPRQVGWFLHTPFPSSEIYRTLPVREEVLRAVLRADLIGAPPGAGPGGWCGGGRGALAGHRLR